LEESDRRAQREILEQPAHRVFKVLPVSKVRLVFKAQLDFKARKAQLELRGWPVKTA
jgi:hypothetical protein